MTHTQSLEEGGGEAIRDQKDNICFRKGVSQLNYMDIRKIMDRRSVQQKKGLLTDAEIQKLVTEWQDVRGKAGLDQATIDREVKTMEEKLTKYNMAALGEVPTQQEDGTYRILVCQMGGCSGKEVRELKIAATERLINKYKVNLSTFMELNYNWATVDSSTNLASWFCHEEREIGLAAANNHHETETRHQPGGTGMVCRHKFLQYARKPSNDVQVLGRWCLWPFYCYPTHSTRIMVTYRTGSNT
jgi:hypothetical protein